MASFLLRRGNGSTPTSSAFLCTMVTCVMVATTALHVDGGAVPTPDLSIMRCRTRSEWKSRSIYQIMTDRYSTDNGLGGFCNNSVLDYDYCGGTFKGIERNLDFIQSMGFDAIWISPINANAPRGYHGYWPSDLYSINPHFSSKKKSRSAQNDLRRLVDAAHMRSMWVMLDSVPNHMGGPTTLPLGVAGFKPFNRPEHYHSCASACDAGCPASECGVGQCACKCSANCQIHQTDYCIESCQEPSAIGVEQCRQAEGLIDLNQTNPYVRKEIVGWHEWVLKKFRFDGFRVDSAKHVYKPFWAYLQGRIPCYMVGEVYQGNPCFVGPYQKVLDGVLNYPLYYAIRDAFGPNKNMNRLGWIFDDNLAAFTTSAGDRGAPFLGNFIDNHDLNRACLELGGDDLMLRNSLTYLLLAEGIPIVFQGTEKLYGCNGDGSNDFARNRRPIWWDGGVRNAPLAALIAELNCWRKAMEVWKYDQKEGWKEDKFYVFYRGPLLVALTNERYNITRTLPGPSHGWNPGDNICNVLAPGGGECFQVDANGGFEVALSGGESKIYVPHEFKNLCVDGMQRVM